MKNRFNLKNCKTLSIVLIASLLAISFTSCKKNSTVTTASGLIVINGAETSAPQDFFLDDTKVNATALAYTQSTGYVAVSPGSHAAQFRTSGTGTVNVSFSALFAPGAYYTVFYTDEKTFAGTQNDPTPALTGKARVRFINLSSAANANTDIFITGGASVVTALPYESFSGYYDVDPTNAFTVKASSSGGASLISIPTGVLQANKIYTVYLSGATTATIAYHLIAEN